MENTSPVLKILNIIKILRMEKVFLRTGNVFLRMNIYF